jgi:glycerol uptake facilitator-like aquaporin
MASLIGPIARIILRYLSGALVVWGVTSGQAANELVMTPEVINLTEVVIGLMLGAATEYWYRLARKFGWET